MTAAARVLVLAALAAAFGGCGSSGGPRAAKTSGLPAPSAPVATTPSARTAPVPGVAPAVAPAPARKATRAQARGYDRAFGALPYRAGPLPVAQTIVSSSRPDLLIARLAPARFFCLGSPARRAAAVASYYRRARAQVRARGLGDLQLVVAPLGRTAQVTVVWARAHAGRVTLTAAGRGGSCRR